MRLFGFEIKRPVQEEPVSFAPPQEDDGAVMVAAGGVYGTYVDLEGSAKSEAELVTRYRDMANFPEVDQAVDDIVNEAICQDDDGQIIQIVLDKLKQPEKIKNAIKAEFQNILRLMNYNNMAQDIFRRYYIDGRMYYHIILDKASSTDDTFSFVFL